ncbi:putative ATP-dependent dsDNA exonuclease (fragment) [Modestobacter italicus]|uniref:Nuclease SbcCD subunit C n=1 Tax=Modestobacter italicus (strain DSM 44449 / CECT 9708 / BC 501) TaxID=2732864 RepID=I4F3B4_MODI5
MIVNMAAEPLLPAASLSRTAEGRLIGADLLPALTAASVHGGVEVADGLAAEAVEHPRLDARVDTALAAARVEEQRHARRDKARADLARLQAEADEIVPLRATLDAAGRADPVRDVLEAAGRAALAAEAAEEELAAVRRRWAAVAGGRAADTLLSRSLRDEVAALRTLLPDVDRAAELAAAVTRTSRQVRTLTAQCAADDAEAAGWPARLAEQEAVVEAAAAADARLAGVTATLERTRSALTAARAAGQLAAEAERRRTASTDAREQWLDARETWTDLRGHRLAGMAAELAAGLADGADCPVCGAVEHPRLATAAGPVVTQDDEDKARSIVDDREERLLTAQRAVEDTERELAALRAQAGPEPLTDQERALAEAVAAERSVREQAATLQPARRELAALLAARDQATVTWAAAREQLTQRRAELQATEQALAEARQRVAAAQGEDPDLAARIRRLTDEAGRCEALVEAEATELRARTAADAARRHAEERVVEAGFADLLAAADALLDPARAARLRQRVAEHDQQWSVVTATLAEPELADLAPRPDLPTLTAALKSATAVREEAVAALAEARRSAAALDALSAELTAVEVELDERRAAAEQVSALADLVNGRGANTLRMRLQSFVLAARLEQVAEVASRRLRDMSGGRYTFLHSDAQGRHGARGGLGLDVLDEYTGARRPTKTLSGGESFMASLALALGLADVVTAESGGVQIDTLFVDEGFGTLDPQSLDAVMTVLDELRRGGRTVGVISHVEELRTRITSRLEVLSGRHGSRLAG